MELEISYFRRRASEERTAALQSRNAPTRRAHVTMAEEYERRVRAMSLQMSAKDAASEDARKTSPVHSLSKFALTSLRAPLRQNGRGRSARGG